MSDCPAGGIAHSEALSQAQLAELMAEMLETQKQTNLLLTRLIAATVEPESVRAVLDVDQLIRSSRAVR